MSELIVKDNALINASYNLDLVEQRLILLAIIEARESGKGINANDPLKIHAESYVNQFNVHRTTAYQALKDACRNLFSRQFSYQIELSNGRVHHKTTRWVSEIGYIEQDAVVDLIFSPAVVPLITRLEENFTKYDLQQVSSLSSAYAIRMYELLICWRSKGKTPIIELEEFRKKIGVLDTEYKRIERLKTSVLDLSLKQINEHTDITVTYEQYKKGRSIIGFSFEFESKTKLKKHNHKKVALERDENTPNMFFNLTEKQITLFAKKLAYNPSFSSKNAKIGEKYSELESRLIDEMRNPEFVSKNISFLKEVGLKI